jgi:hypothetical protein
MICGFVLSEPRLLDSNLSGRANLYLKLSTPSGALSFFFSADTLTTQVSFVESSTSRTVFTVTTTSFTNSRR